jgi:hypothetical protein
MRHAAPLVVGVLALVAQAGWSVAAQAQAQPPAPPAPVALAVRRANFAWDPKLPLLRASFSYRDVLDAELQRKLQSGLPTVIVMRAYVFQDGKPEAPVSGTIRSCRVAYHVWDEVYRLQISQQSGGETNTVAVNLEGVLRQCAEARELAVADRALLVAGASYYLAAMVEVNPVSKEMLERIRRWVSRPPNAAGATPGDSLFGSFVGLFVARIGEADRTLAFRTQPLVVPR